ncbi:MAG: hypothetical protein ABFD24_08700 [Anaerolineaceae bacterium]
MQGFKFHRFLVREYVEVFNPVPGIRAVIDGDFSQLPENPSHNDWQAFALMINGYDLAQKLGLGEMESFVFDQCLATYDKSGELPDKAIELWICLNGAQRRVSWSSYDIESNDEKTALAIYSKLRCRLVSINGVKELENILMSISEQDEFKRALLHRFWAYAESKHQPWDKYFDRPNHDYSRPPVFLAREGNMILNPDPVLAGKLTKMIPAGEYHKWFNSMASSQALTLSVLGNLFLEKHLSILADLTDDDGIPLLGNKAVSVEKFSLENKIDYLGEPRQTSIDGFIAGEYQIAVECKFTEAEIGSCSRPRLTKKDSNYQHDYCDGSYTRQANHKERCTLTENGIRYWEYVPKIFKWQNNIDLRPCPLLQNYQLVRNILAASVKPDQPASSINGHAILIFDERNPSCQPNGAIHKAYTETKNALLEPKMLRKISWQRIVDYMRKEEFQPWLTEALREKYGL